MKRCLVYFLRNNSYFDRQKLAGKYSKRLREPFGSTKTRFQKTFKPHNPALGVEKILVSFHFYLHHFISFDIYSLSAYINSVQNI